MDFIEATGFIAKCDSNSLSPTSYFCLHITSQLTALCNKLFPLLFVNVHEISYSR
jgi:hypothetical protein